MKLDKTVIEKKVSQLQKIYRQGAGKAAAIQILKLSSRAEMDEILRQLKENNRNIFTDLEHVLLFEDLEQLNAEEIKKINEHFSPKIIGLALRLGTKTLRENFLRAVDIKEKKAIESVITGPPQKKSDVESAITHIMMHVRKLQRQGSLKLTSQTGSKQVFV